MRQICSSPTAFVSIVMTHLIERLLDRMVHSWVKSETFFIEDMALQYNNLSWPSSLAPILGAPKFAEQLNGAMSTHVRK
jgi:hypothetical protein